MVFDSIQTWIVAKVVLKKCQDEYAVKSLSKYMEGYGHNKMKMESVKKERPENIIKMKSNFIKKILTHKDQLLVTNTKGKMRVKI